MEPFTYLKTLVEKVNMFSKEVTYKNWALVSAQVSLSRVEATLDESNWSLDLAKKG